MAKFARIATGSRYEGSLTACHGEIVALDDCRCENCITLDLLDEHRLAQVIVHTDDGRLMKLEHVAWEHTGPDASRDLTSYSYALTR